MIGTLLGAKLGVAIAAGAVSLGGVTAAAYAGALPSGLQDFAHTTVGAPAADHGKAADSSKSHGVGPDAKGAAAFGLCNAWSNHQDKGKAATKSVAFRNLATAAGGENKIAAYCAKVPHPAPDASEKSEKPETSKAHPSGKPTSLPSHGPSSPGASRHT